MASGAAVLLHLPVPEAARELQSLVPLLPRGLRLFALYLQAHHAYLQGGLRQVRWGWWTRPLPCAGETYPIVDVYLHLAAVMGPHGPAPDRAGAGALARGMGHRPARRPSSSPSASTTGFSRRHARGHDQARVAGGLPPHHRHNLPLLLRLGGRVHNPATGDDRRRQPHNHRVCHLHARGARAGPTRRSPEHLGVSAKHGQELRLLRPAQAGHQEAAGPQAVHAVYSAIARARRTWRQGAVSHPFFLHNG